MLRKPFWVKLKRMTLISKINEGGNHHIIMNFSDKGFKGPVYVRLDGKETDEIRNFLDDQYLMTTAYWFDYTFMWIMALDTDVLLELKLKYENVHRVYLS